MKEYHETRDENSSWSCGYFHKQKHHHQKRRPSCDMLKDDFKKTTKLSSHVYMTVPKAPVVKAGFRDLKRVAEELQQWLWQWLIYIADKHNERLDSIYSLLDTQEEPFKDILKLKTVKIRGEQRKVLEACLPDCSKPIGEELNTMLMILMMNGFLYKEIIDAMRVVTIWRKNMSQLVSVMTI